MEIPAVFSILPAIFSANNARIDPQSGSALLRIGKRRIGLRAVGVEPIMLKIVAEGSWKITCSS